MNNETQSLRSFNEQYKYAASLLFIMHCSWFIVHCGASRIFGGTNQNRTGDGGFADLCLTAWLWCQKAKPKKWSGLRGSNSLPPPWQGGALPNELNPHLHSFVFTDGGPGRNRTNDTRIFSPLLYQLSYRAVLCGEMATRKGLEPSTSSVTGWHSNQLNYRAVFRSGPSGIRTPDQPVMSRPL